jgi:hypothetical protein
MSEPKKNTTQAFEPVWFTCEVCEDWYCAIHDEHVGECICPDIEDWPYDPRTGDLIPPPERGTAL